MSDREEINITVDEITLKGNLIVQKGAKAIVVFAHGSGSGRFSPRNNFVAEQLRKAGLATLLMDLLTEEEEAIDIQTRELRFDIPLLAERVIGTIKWLKEHENTKKLKIGLFGASTGAAAALIAAAKLPDDIYAVVSRGGRVDLAETELPNVKAPTLLIVGEHDGVVIELNKDAMKQLHAETKLEIVPGATHLFEELGKLEKVAELAADWFSEHLKP